LPSRPTVAELSSKFEKGSMSNVWKSIHIAFLSLLVWAVLNVKLGEARRLTGAPSQFCKYCCSGASWLWCLQA
jgi:ABC-type uncharacterized transport system permease subunit